MATDSPRLRLLHIRDEIDGITATLKETNFERYSQSYPMRRAAERAVQIISEAAKSLPKDMLDKYPEAPWRAIIGIGNILRHEYQRVDDRRLWDIATVHLPHLHPIILRMLEECA